MKQLTAVQQSMLDDGVSYRALETDYEKESFELIRLDIAAEAKKENHRVWFAFHPTGKKNPETEIRAELMYELFYKEAWQANLYLKERMLIDLLKMGNKKRYSMDMDMDFIAIPDFYKTAYNDMDKSEVPSVLRWMRYASDRYGVGFVLFCDTYDLADLEKLYLCDVPNRYRYNFREVPVGSRV